MDEPRADARANEQTWFQRWHVGIVSVLASITAGLGILQSVGLTSEAIARGGAIGSVMAGVTLGGRHYVHLAIGYRNWRDPHPELAGEGWNPEDPKDARPRWGDRERGRLNELLLVNSALIAALLANGGWFFFHPHNALQLGVSLVLTAVMASSVFSMRDLLQVPGAPRRGSERVEKCEPVRWMRLRSLQVQDTSKVPIRLYRWLFRKTDPSQPSGLAVVLVFFTLAVGGAHGASYLPAAGDYIAHKQIELEPSTPRGDEFEQGVVAVTKPQPPPSGGAKPPPDPVNYETLCGTQIAPGDGAPEPLRSQLHRAWSAYGGGVAGCAARARRIPGTDTYYVLGHLAGGQFVSIGVASPQHPGVVLIDSPARLARRLAKAKALLGTSGRELIGTGDFHVLYTRNGGWVTIRRNRGDELYVELPPRLAGLWLRFGDLFEPSWPVRTALTDSGGTYFQFYGLQGPQAEVASGYCFDDNAKCELRSGNIRWRSWEAGRGYAVTVERVRAHGPR